MCKEFQLKPLLYGLLQVDEGEIRMHSEQENNSFPAEFLERMKEMLGEEYPAFLKA